MDTRKFARRFAVAVALGMCMLVVPLPQMAFVQSAVAAVEPLPGVEPVTPDEIAQVQAAAEEPLGPQRVRSVAQDIPAFALLGVVFEAPPGEPVMVRVKLPDGTWDAWTELHIDPGEGPDSRTNWGTEPFWVDSAVGYELGLAPAAAESAEVVLVRNSVHRTVAVSEPVAAAATGAPFGIHTRGGWGARPSKEVRYGSSVRKAVVHHTVNSNGYSQSQVPGMLRGIQAYHQDGRGWDDIGYNFVVDRFGGIWEAREGGIDRPVIGAHASGWNTNTVGIALLGDFSHSRPSAAAIEGVSRVAGWKLFLGGVEPTGSGNFTSGGGPRYPAGTVVNLPNVVGHGDVGSTSCPGRTREVLGQIRQRAQDWANWSKAVSAPVGNLERLGSSGSTVTATGWAGQRGWTGDTRVWLTVDGRSTETLTDISRPDVNAAVSGLPATTGFRVTLTGVDPGIQRACVTVLSDRSGPNLSLGCRDIRVADPTGLSPDGRIDGYSTHPGSVEVKGWTTDADGALPRRLILDIDGRASIAQWSTTKRFEVTARGVPAGEHKVCVRVENSGGGVDTRIGCKVVSVPPGSPFGTFDGFSQSGRRVSVWGWAIDRSTRASIDVLVAAQGSKLSFWRVAANRPRPDVAAAIPGYGPNHGYSHTMNLPAGRYDICAAALNEGSGSHTLLGCRQVVVK